jgi:hypothetical protein
MGPLRREIVWRPGYDHMSNPDPKERSKGRHGMDVTFLIHGAEGAVQFRFNTMWTPGIVKESSWGLTVDPATKHVLAPMARDLGHHWHTPTYEGESLMESRCEIANGPCYYDGSGLNAEHFLGLLLTKGDGEVWAELEAYYRRCSENARATAEGRNTWLAEAYESHRP